MNYEFDEPVAQDNAAVEASDEAVADAPAPEAPKDERFFSPSELETYLEKIKADLREAKRGGNEEEVAALKAKFDDLASRLK